MSDLRESTQGLPEQIAIELHFTGGAQWANHIPIVSAKNQVQMSLFFLHMANLGYGIISREDNPDANIGCCRCEQRVKEGKAAAGARCSCSCVLSASQPRCRRPLGNPTHTLKLPHRCACLLCAASTASCAWSST